MNKFNRDYVTESLRGEVTTNLFDGGITYRLAVGQDRRQFTYYWGDDDAYFNRVITRWLNSLPWPSEDDPRVISEGVYLP